MSLKLTLFNRDGNVLSAKNDYEDESQSLNFQNENNIFVGIQNLVYQEGDYFEIQSTVGNQFLVVQLDQTMSPSVVYLKNNFWKYELPLHEKWRDTLSDVSYKSKRHYISVRKAKQHEISAYQNLSLNTYDTKEFTGAYPHASANVETRDDATFFAMNAIDGVYANTSHGSYPFQSWGINKQEDAEIKIDFGRNVIISEVEITLRADFPHDNYWVKGTIQFSDGEEEILEFEKTGEPQIFQIDNHLTDWIKVKKLIKSNDSPSPFPALTQLTTYGKNAISVNVGG